MAITSGLFNSVNGDRRYDAKWFAQYFATFIGNGVFPNPSTGLQVTESANMRTVVKPGKGWINGYFIVNDSDYVLQHDVADGVLKRIDRVVMRLNYLSRQIEIVVKKGTFASTPAAPLLQRDADVYELALADVHINNGATFISQANITDTRLNKALCGIVHGVVDQIDTTSLFAQYDAGFNEWFESIKDILDGDVAANLANRISDLEGTFNTLDNKVTTHLADYTQFKSSVKQKHKVSEDGGDSIQIDSGNMNNLIRAGFYTIHAGVLNSPTNDYYHVQVLSHGDGAFVIQIAQNMFSNTFYMRRKQAGSWQPWSLDLFQSVVDGKNSLKATVRAKGGTVSDVNNPPTFADLVAGVNSLNAFVPGSSVFASSPAEVSHSSETWKTAKRMTFNKAMKVRISFAVRSFNTFYQGYGQVFINGVAVGTRRWGTQEYYTTYSEDFDLKVGDVVELRIYANFSGYGVYVRDFTAGIDSGVVVNL